MALSKSVTITLSCNNCSKVGGEAHSSEAAVPRMPVGWVGLFDRAFCSEECVVEDARVLYREFCVKDEKVA